MIVLIRLVAASLPLIALPALAAESMPSTGITNVGPAAFLFAVAAALFLTLVFRSTASHLIQQLSARYGQLKARRLLQQHSKDSLHSFIITGAYGGLAKIDHAIMTPGGILCIQTKHYNGLILGAEDDAQWTVVDGSSRKRFLNPLIQNEGRRRALQNIVPDAPVDNLVIFTGNVQFPAPPPKNVIRIDQFESFLAKFVFGPSRVDDWDAVWMSVRSAAQTDEDAHKDFQAQIA